MEKEKFWRAYRTNKKDRSGIGEKSTPLKSKSARRVKKKQTLEPSLTYKGGGQLKRVRRKAEKKRPGKPRQREHT